MKWSECNARQKKAWLNVIHGINWIVGGLENTMEDNGKDSEEYKDAERQLSNHDELAERIYEEVTTTVFEDGCMSWGASETRYLKDIRFCGKAWIMERIDRRLKKLGY